MGNSQLEEFYSSKIFKNSRIKRKASRGILQKLEKSQGFTRKSASKTQKHKSSPLLIKSKYTPLNKKNKKRWRLKVNSLVNNGGSFITPNMSHSNSGIFRKTGGFTQNLKSMIQASTTKNHRNLLKKPRRTNFKLNSNIDCPYDDDSAFRSLKSSFLKNNNPKKDRSKSRKFKNTKNDNRRPKIRKGFSKMDSIKKDAIYIPGVFSGQGSIFERGKLNNLLKDTKRRETLKIFHLNNN